MELCQMKTNNLQDKSFYVQIEEKYTTYRLLEAAVLQGSIVEPLLYNFYKHDIPKNPRNLLTQYADVSDE